MIERYGSLYLGLAASALDKNFLIRCFHKPGQISSKIHIKIVQKNSNFDGKKEEKSE